MKALADLAGSNAAILNVEQIGPAVKTLTDWKPEIEKIVGELKDEIHELRE